MLERIKEITKGQGPDSVMDCVGMEASGGGHGIMGAISAVQEKLTSMQRPYALEQMITAVRSCGIVSVPGVYAGPVPVNMASVVQKGLTMKTGQTHVKRYMEPLTKLIQDGKIDPTFLITHRSTDLNEGPDLYKTFRDKKIAASRWCSICHSIAKPSFVSSESPLDHLGLRNVGQVRGSPRTPRKVKVTKNTKKQAGVFAGKPTLLSSWCLGGFAFLGVLGARIQL